MSFISGLRERISTALEDAERAATNAANAASKVAEKAKEAIRAAAPEAPAPSAASIEHAQSAAADAAKNASPKRSTNTKEMGVFAGFGGSAVAGAAGDGVGGQASAGYVIGAGGTMKSYGSTGVSSGAVGASAGVGFEAGVVVSDVRDFYGDGYQLSASVPGVPVSASLGFDRDRHLTTVSVSAGKSIGAGLFHFDTHTENTSGR